MKIKSRNIAGAVLTVSGILMIAAAAVLFLYNTNESRTYEKEAADRLPALRQAIEERLDKSGRKDDVLVNNIPVIDIDGNEYTGILEIPSLQLETPVFSGWNDDNLKKAPCRYYGRADKDDLVIAGHNYSSGFGKLENLNRGENVYFTDINGRVYAYTVAETEILEAGDVVPMIDSPWALSLYTCTYSGKQRFTVRCKKT